MEGDSLLSNPAHSKGSRWFLQAGSPQGLGMFYMLTLKKNTSTGSPVSSFLPRYSWVRLVRALSSCGIGPAEETEGEHHNREGSCSMTLAATAALVLPTDSR